MSTLIYSGMGDAYPGLDDEQVSGNYTQPVRNDAPPSEAQGAPEWNEPETDPNPEIGLGQRQVASDWHQPERYVPLNYDQSKEIIDATRDIDNRISSDGVAPAKEAVGQWGHGTAAYAVGIEPTIRDGAAYGNDYFAANDARLRSAAVADESEERGVQPALGLDRDDIIGLSAYGKAASHEAAAASQTAMWYDQIVNG